MSISGLSAAGSTIAYGFNNVSSGVARIAAGAGDIAGGVADMATGVVSGIEEAGDTVYGSFSATGTAIASGLQTLGSVIDAVV